jgi:hypothetical protein
VHISTTNPKIRLSEGAFPVSNRSRTGDLTQNELACWQRDIVYSNVGQAGAQVGL